MLTVVSSKAKDKRTYFELTNRLVLLLEVISDFSLNLSRSLVGRRTLCLVQTKIHLPAAV